MPLTVVTSSSSRQRVDRAAAWLSARPPADEVLLVAASAEAANELLRGLAAERGAVFGVHRATLPRLAASLAELELSRRGLARIGRLAFEALVARVVFELRAEGALGRFEPVGDAPGLPRALASVIEELRLQEIPTERVEPRHPELAAVRRRVEGALDEASLADRAAVIACAVEVLERRGAEIASTDDEAPGEHPWLDLPVLVLDASVATRAERRLLAAVVARAPDALATVPAGDERTTAALAELGGGEATRLEERDPSGALERLQRFLFEERAVEGELDGEVAILSAPGESREAVEIARRILRFSGEGIPFDEMAVLLRGAEEYRAHLEEAFHRAGIPAFFARGTRRPDPSGRALLALLACAADGLSATAFAEYLSIGEVPDATAEGAPPTAPPEPERWIAADEEMLPERLAEADVEARHEAGTEVDAPASEGAGAPAAGDPVVAGSLRTPRRWERLINDAAVIGSRERWEKRLAGLKEELELKRSGLDDAEGPRAEGLGREIAALDALREFALPLLDELAALPQRATWSEWIDRLTALSTRALRRPERVLSVLAELAPMGPVGPATLGEVRLVLSRRLLELTVPPAKSRHGSVFVAPADAARGLAFDVVFVPGLAEKLFPKKISEEPILLDGARKELDAALPTLDDRVDSERLCLRLAVGAARRKLVLSYPRIDLDQSRPRVPSFYALEALRAAEGRLPGFEELAGRAERVAQARVGWPAPDDPAEAIDEAEHDIALLRPFLREPDAHVGTAQYLLDANPHLGRALRFRARRWTVRSWTVADGLVAPRSGESPCEGALEAIAEHAPSARSFSPTALQNYASCPYKLFLYTVLKLGPREVPEAIEEMDPLQVGSLVHAVQYRLLTRLRDEGALPVRPASLERARDALDEVLDALAAEEKERLHPAIERTWDDGIAAIRADLREWLRRASEDESGWTPWKFELAFGLPEDRDADPDSRPEPVRLDSGLAVRGSIDLVERDAAGALRATDHKTGKQRVKDGEIVSGGSSLQPVLYALAVEQLFPDARVDSGRLYYCTTRGGFEEASVALDDEARDAARVVAETVGAALEGPFLPAAPAPRACEWCDYQVVCGPYEERRTGRRRKNPKDLEALQRLRELP